MKLYKKQLAVSINLMNKTDDIYTLMYWFNIWSKVNNRINNLKK